MAALALCATVCAGANDVPSVAIVFGHHSYMDSPEGEGASLSPNLDYSRGGGIASWLGISVLVWSQAGRLRV